MRKSWVKRGLVCGIIVLFVGASVIPVISGDIGNSTNAKDVDGETAGVGEKTQANPNGGARPLGWDKKTTELVSVGCDKNAINPSIAVDHSRTVHAAWCEWDTGTRYFIYYSSRNPLTGLWSPKEQVSTESDLHENANESVSLAIEETGAGVKVHVAWPDWSDDYMGYNYYGTKIFYKCKDPNGVWGLTEVVSSESNQFAVQPSLAVDINGRVHIAWADYTNYNGCGPDSDIFYKCKTGGSWPTTTELVSTESDREAQYPSLAWDKYTDTVHVAWMDKTRYTDPVTNIYTGKNYKIFYKCKDVTWSTTELVSTESLSPASYPSLDTDSYSRVHIAWGDRTTTIPNAGVNWRVPCGPTSNIFYKSKPGTCNGWFMFSDVVSTDSTISPYGTDSACLVIAPDDSIHIAWHDNSSRWPYHDILYKLGAGTPYTFNRGLLHFRGHGVLDNTNGIYDFDLKVKNLIIPIPFLFSDYFLIFGFLGSVVNHHPDNFLYTHGTFDIPLPSSFTQGGQCSLVFCGLVGGFSPIFILFPIGLTGRSYP